MALKILFAPSNLGYTKSSSDLFPGYLVKKGLFKMLDKLNVKYQKCGIVQPGKLKTNIFCDQKCKYFPQVAGYNQYLSKKLSKSITSKKDLPLVIGGDHSITIGVVQGLLTKRRSLSVLWLDAHPDAHTNKTTQTGWIYGMPVAAICGFGKKEIILKKPKVSPGNISIFGTQYMDELELKNIKTWGVNLFTMEQIIDKGISDCLKKAVNKIKKNSDYLHLSLDLDVVDEMFAPGTSEYSLGQLTYREIKYVLKKLADWRVVNSMDIVEGDPEKDIQGKTASLALELIATLLGKSYSPYDQYLVENRI